MNIEEGRLQTREARGVSIRNGMEQDAPADQVADLFLKRKRGQLAKALFNVRVAVDMQLARVAPAQHLRADEAQHPYRAQQMVAVGMGQDDMMNIRPGDAGAFQLDEDAVAAARVAQNDAAFGFDGKAGVVAFGYDRVARAQHDKLIHKATSG